MREPTYVADVLFLCFTTDPPIQSRLRKRDCILGVKLLEQAVMVLIERPIGSGLGA